MLDLRRHFDEACGDPVPRMRECAYVRAHLGTVVLVLDYVPQRLAQTGSADPVTKQVCR